MGNHHDNYGRLFYSRAASGIAASGFNINPVYGQLDLFENEDSGFAKVWPIVKTPDVNGGPATLRADSTIFGFTSVCGQSVFRGDRLPASVIGDYLACEPVGRFIRRAKLINNDGKIQLKNAYEQDEFITSTDMNFRPVNTYTGPDGCLYIVDMYRGIIQESTWAQPGSFLYSQIMSKGLNKNIKNGRIYRLVHDGYQRGPKPKMLHESSASLLLYLDHANGWWRDNAQKEIIVRNDQSAVASLKQIALGNKGPLPKIPSPLARLHALWTLEGLEAIDRATLLKAMDDNDPQVRKAAIWISERFLKKDDNQVIEKLEALKDDERSEVLTQLVLSLNPSTVPKAKAIVSEVLAKNVGRGIFAGIQNTFARNEETKKYGAKLVDLKEADRKMVMNGAKIFQSLCVSCHGPEGVGLPTKIAPPLIGKFKLLEYKDGVIRIMLHGLKGPVDGATYPDHMPAWVVTMTNG
jgi:mono/diheme cytochrome c family protein